MLDLFYFRKKKYKFLKNVFFFKVLLENFVRNTFFIERFNNYLYSRICITFFSVEVNSLVINIFLRKVKLRKRLAESFPYFIKLNSIVGKEFLNLALYRKSNYTILFKYTSVKRKFVVINFFYKIVALLLFLTAFVYKSSDILVFVAYI